MPRFHFDLPQKQSHFKFQTNVPAGLRFLEHFVQVRPNGLCLIRRGPTTRIGQCKLHAGKQVLAARGERGRFVLLRFRIRHLSLGQKRVDQCHFRSQLIIAFFLFLKLPQRIAQRLFSLRGMPFFDGMPWGVFRNLDDEDLDALFAYLRALPPVKHRVDNTEPPTYCKLCRNKHGFGNLN